MQKKYLTVLRSTEVAQIKIIDQFGKKSDPMSKYFKPWEIEFTDATSLLPRFENWNDLDLMVPGKWNGQFANDKNEIQCTRHEKRDRNTGEITQQAFIVERECPVVVLDLDNIEIPARVADPSEPLQVATAVWDDFQRDHAFLRGGDVLWIASSSFGFPCSAGKAKLHLVLILKTPLLEHDRQALLQSFPEGTVDLAMSQVARKHYFAMSRTKEGTPHPLAGKQRCGVFAGQPIDWPATPKPVKPQRTQREIIVASETTQEGRKVLDRQCTKIRKSGAGERHNVALSAAYTVGGFASAGLIVADEALSSLLAAVDANPNEDDHEERHGTIETAFNDGMNNPIEITPEQDMAQQFQGGTGDYRPAGASDTPITAVTMPGFTGMPGMPPVAGMPGFPTTNKTTLEILTDEALAKPDNITPLFGRVALLSKTEQTQWINAAVKVSAASGFTTKAELKAAIKAAKPKRNTGPAYYCDAEDNVYQTEKNVSIFLNETPEWEGVFIFDAFANNIVVTRPYQNCKIKDETEYPRAIADHDFLSVHMVMQEQAIFPTISQQKVISAIQDVAQSQRVNPLTDYLNGLIWDGVPRTQHLLSNYFRCEVEDDLHRELNAHIGQRFMIAAVARAMNPGCKVDTVLCIGGRQGLKKSSSLRELAVNPDWFSDGLPDLSGNIKEVAEHLAGNWIIEIGEMEALRGASMGKVKRFLTSQTDKFRPAYGRVTETFPRSNVFAATFDGYEPLRDPSGNRRYWVVYANFIDRDAITRDRDQLWAEAVYHFKQGWRWWFDDVQDAKYMAKIANVTDKHRSVSIDEAKFRAWLEPQDGPVTVEAARNAILPHEDGGTAATRKLNEWGKAAGWEPYRVGPEPRLRRGK